MEIESALKALQTAVLQAQGRQIADEFAIMQLIASLPNTGAALAHWDDGLAKFSDHRLGDDRSVTTKTVRDAMDLQLAKYFEVLQTVHSQRPRK